MGEYVNAAAIFGENVFNDKVMQERLPKNVYKKLKKPFKSVSWETMIPICGVLRNFFDLPDSDNYCNYLIKNDYISVLLNAVRSNIEVEPFLTAAFSVLELIVRSVDGCGTFLALRGVPEITELVCRHKDNEALCAAGLRVLASCSLDKSSFKELVDKGIIDIVLQHIDTAGPQLLAVLLEIVKNMTGDAEYAQKIEDAGVVEHFSGIFDRYGENEEVMVGLSGSCMHMCYSERSKTVFLNDEVVSKLLKVMATHAASRDIQYFGSSTIVAMMTFSEICEMLMESGILSILIPAIALLAENAAAQTVLFDILQRLLAAEGCEFTAESFNDYHFLVAVGKSLDAHSENESIVIPVLTTLVEVERRVKNYYAEVEDISFFKAFAKCYRADLSSDAVVDLMLQLLLLFNTASMEMAQMMLEGDVLYMAMSLLNITKDNTEVMERALLFVDAMCKFMECCQYVVMNAQGVPTLLRVFRLLNRADKLPTVLSVFMSLTQYRDLFEYYAVEEVISTAQSCLTTYEEEPVILYESMIILGNLAVVQKQAEMLVARGIVSRVIEIVDRFHAEHDVMLASVYLLQFVCKSKVACEQMMKLNSVPKLLEYYQSDYLDDEEITYNLLACIHVLCEEEPLLETFLETNGCEVTLQALDRFKESYRVVFYCLSIIIQIYNKDGERYGSLYEEERIKMYYDFLATFASKTRVVVVAMQLLTLLGKDETTSDMLIEWGISETICAGFEQYQAKPTVLTAMLDLAAVLAFWDRNKQKMLEDDMVNLALDCLANNSENQKVVTSNLLFHVQMARSKLCSSAYYSTDCVNLTLSLLPMYQTVEDVCEPALSLLLYLTAMDPRLERYNSDEALKEILDVLQMNEKSERLQERGCQLLQMLSSNLSICGRLVRLNAVTLLCNDVNLFTTQREIQVCGNSALYALTCEEGSVSTMLNLGVIYTHMSVLSSFASDRDVQNAVMHVEAVLCDVPMGCTLFFNENGLLKVFAAMNEFTHDAELLSSCCDIIAHCLQMIPQDDTFPVLLHNNCMMLVLNILDNLHTDVSLQNSALAVIREMVLQPEYQTQFMDYQGPEVLERSIYNEHMLDTAVMSVMSIIHSLTQSEKMCKKLLRLELMNNLIDVINMFSGNKRVNKDAAKMWEMATRNKELAELLLDTQVIPQLVRILNIYQKTYVQTPLMKAFLHLLSTQEKKAALLMIESAVIKACAYSLKMFAMSADVVRPCVEVLITLIKYPEAHEPILNVPLLPDLIAVIGQEGQSEQLQSRCVVLLKKMMFLAGSRLSLRSVSDIRVLVGVIRTTLKSDRKILNKCLRVVARSLTLVNLYEKIGSSELPEAICDVMLHINEEKTQGLCVEIMALLVKNSDETVEVFMRRDVISILVDNLRVYADNKTMSQNCCMAFAFLTKHEEVVTYIAMMSVSKLIMDSMRRDRSVRHVMYCAQCIANISANENCCKELIENEAVQELLALCASYISEEDTLGAITYALYCLSLDERSHEVFGANHCVEVFTDVMTAWIKRPNDEILCNIFSTVFNLYRVRSVLTALKSGVLLELIIKVVNSNLSKNLAKAFTLLCSRLAEDAELRPVLVRCRAVMPILKCIRDFQRGRTINSKGFAALNLLGQQEEVMQELLENSILSECLKSLDIHKYAEDVILAVMEMITLLEKFAVKTEQVDHVKDVDVSDVVIKVIVENGYENAVLRSGLAALESFLPFDEDGRQLYSHDATTVVIQSLGKLYEEKETQVLTLRVLKVALRVPETADSFEREDGIKLLLQVVATFYDAVELQLEAMEVIGELAMTEELQSILFENQALNYLVHALANFSEEPTVLLAAEVAIQEMCAYEPVCQTLFDLGAISMLVGTLEKYPKNAELMLVTCNILNICAQNANFVPTVSKFKIVELVLKCVVAMREQAEVLCALLLTLFYLVDLSEELAKVFQSKRGPEQVSETWSLWEAKMNAEEEPENAADIGSVLYYVLHCITAYAGDVAIIPRLMSLHYVERIAAAMELFDNDKAVLREALIALARMGSAGAVSEAPKRVMLEKNVVMLAIMAMGSFLDQKRLLVAGATVLKLLYSEEQREKMENSNLVSTCVQALARHGSFREMVKTMSELLLELVNEATYVQFKEQKALNVLMDCLAVHVEDEECCIALLRLVVAVLFTAVAQGEGVSTRIVETAVFIMNNYTDSEEVQKLGIELLEAFVTQEGDMMAFLELGGLDVVVRAMRNDSEYIRSSCCKLLFAASKTAVVRDAIVQVDGVAMLMLAMKEHPKCAPIHQYASAALANMVTTHEVCMQVANPPEMELDGLKLLFTSLKTFKTAREVEESLTQVLDRLLEAEEELRKRFCALHPLEVLQEVLSNFKESEEVAYNVCGVLSSLAAEVASRVGRHNRALLQLVDECMEIHQEKARAESHIVKVVATFGTDANCLAFFVEKDTYRLIRDVLNAFQKEKDVVAVSIRALLVFTSEARCLENLEDADILTLCSSIMYLYHNDGAIMADVCKLLLAFTAKDDWVVKMAQLDLVIKVVLVLSRLSEHRDAVLSAVHLLRGMNRPAVKDKFKDTNVVTKLIECSSKYLLDLEALL